MQLWTYVLTVLKLQIHMEVYYCCLKIFEAYDIITVIMNEAFDIVIANVKHNQCVKHAKVRGFIRHAPQGNFLKLRCSEIEFCSYKPTSWQAEIELLVLYVHYLQRIHYNLLYFADFIMIIITWFITISFF